MRMVWVDDHGPRARRPRQRRVPRPPGHLLARVLRARPRVPHRRHADLRAPPVAVRPDRRRAARPAGRAAARRLRRSRSWTGGSRSRWATARSRSTRRREPTSSTSRPSAWSCAGSPPTTSTTSSPSTAIRRSCATSPAARRRRATRCATTTCRPGSPTTTAATRGASGRRSSARPARSSAGSTCGRSPRTRTTSRSSGTGSIRSAWGRGYATEGSRALVDKAFAELGARRVHASTMAVNAGSRRVMEKAGMRFVRTFVMDWPVRIEGDEEGDVEYAITARRVGGRPAAAR